MEREGCSFWLSNNGPQSSGSLTEDSTFPSTTGNKCKDTLCMGEPISSHKGMVPTGANAVLMQ